MRHENRFSHTENAAAKGDPALFEKTGPTEEMQEAASGNQPESLSAADTPSEDQSADAPPAAE